MYSEDVHICEATYTRLCRLASTNFEVTIISVRQELMQAWRSHLVLSPIITDFL